MMRFLIFISLFFPLAGFAATSSEVHACIKETKTTYEPVERERLARACFQKAAEFERSDSLEKRALYFSAWHLFLQTKISDRDYLERMFTQLKSYFDPSLRPFISLANLSEASDLTIQAAYAATDTMDWYSAFGIDQSTFDLKMVLWDLKVSRNLATAEDAQFLVSSLFRMHKWARIRELISTYPNIEPRTLPRVIEDIQLREGEMGFYTFSPDMQTMTLERFSVATKGPQVVMVAFCHFAWDAMAEFSSHDEINQFMKDHGVVVTMPDFADLETINKINSSYPSFQMHMAHDFYSWTNAGLRLFSSPSFFFLKDGVLIAQSSGHNLAQFCENIRKIGVSFPNACR